MLDPSFCCGGIGSRACTTPGRGTGLCRGGLYSRAERWGAARRLGCWANLELLECQRYRGGQEGRVRHLPTRRHRTGCRVYQAVGLSLASALPSGAVPQILRCGRGGDGQACAGGRRRRKSSTQGEEHCGSHASRGLASGWGCLAGGLRGALRRQSAGSSWKGAGALLPAAEDSLPRVLPPREVPYPVVSDL